MVDRYEHPFAADAAASVLVNGMFLVVADAAKAAAVVGTPVTRQTLAHALYRSGYTAAEVIEYLDDAIRAVGCVLAEDAA